MPTSGPVVGHRAQSVPRTGKHRRRLLSHLLHRRTRPGPSLLIQEEKKATQEKRRIKIMAHAARIKMPNGDRVDIKALVGDRDWDERLHSVPLRVYTVSCDDILFRTCVGGHSDRINDDGATGDVSSDWSSRSPRQK
ncbi:hypothetical protein psal_cds_181 [Pandoravirus salinus]|uniref:Uncharacterized protein n=1 Tax=Pandoravirus salinus TaxID=1349410 RepID=A0A291ATE0_9VIRU|nr:hypothetical protein psal_cds_181 [Pandoravirus salinus]ATE82130.1 hypothetical protein psal_cds_181 [Pandoravirus salinus]